MKQSLHRTELEADFRFGLRHQRPVWREIIIACAFVWVWSSVPRGVAAGSQVVAWGGNTYGETNVPAGIADAVTVAGGSYHCLSLSRDGSITAWGSNSYGQTNVPPDVGTAVQITAGWEHSLALRSDGSLRLWGTMLYNIGTNVPASATNLAVLAEGPGAEHVFGLRHDGSLFAWGGLHGESVIPPSVTNAACVAAGGQFSVAVRGDGSIAVWGDNTGGQTNVPATATNIVAAAAGYNHVAALRADRTLLIWGSLSHPPAGATNIVEVACGGNHVLALRGDGTIWAYGQNGYRQATVPPGISNITAIAGTANSSIALIGAGPPVLASPPVDRTVVSGSTAYFRALAHGAGPMNYQWKYFGTNIPNATNSIYAVPNIQTNQGGTFAVSASNQLGVVISPDFVLKVLPLMINIQPLNQPAFVGENVTLTVSAAGQGPLSYQWHFNGVDLPGATTSSLVLMNVQQNQEGNYSVTVSNLYTSLFSSNALVSVVPILITTEPQSQSIFPGGTATLTVLAQAGSTLAYQWQFNGTNLSGATASSLAITNIQYNQSGIYRVTLSTGSATTNSLDCSLSVVPVAAWGLDIYGDTSVPPGLSNVLAISAGVEASFALRTDGSVVGWGNALVATVPMGLSNAIAVGVGGLHAVALKANGTVVAWGANSSGQTNVPAWLTNAIAVASGGNCDHALALRDDGTVVGWGRNVEGQTNLPLGLSNVVAIAVGDDHSLALRADGTVAAWGDNYFGQIDVPAGLSNVVAIAGGSINSVALLDNGTVVGWSSNNWGQNSLNVTDAVAIAAGDQFTIALRVDGTLISGGYPWHGQTNIPTGLHNVVAIAAGNYHNLALVGTAPPTLYCKLSNPSWSNNRLSVTVPTISGHVYRLEDKNSLSDPNWTPLPLVAGTGRDLTLSDPAASGPHRFYRVRQW